MTDRESLETPVATASVTGADGTGPGPGSAPPTRIPESHPAVREGAAIATSGLTKDFGAGHGIFDLDLVVERGEAFGLIGPNGAGKTTTLRLLMALLKPTRGGASIMGFDTERDAVEVKRRTGYLPGEAPDYPNHRVGQILDLLAHLRGDVDPARVTALADRFHLDLGARYRDLSHGNRQKVWLVQAFMHEPALLLLDEPTTGLDPLMQETFRDLVAEARDRGATVLLSSHVLSEVEEMCDRIAVVQAGRLQRVGTLDTLRTRHSYAVRAMVARPLDERRLTAIDDVSAVRVHGATVECRVDDGLDDVIALLHDAGVVSLQCTEMTLEELYLTEYGHQRDA